MAAAAIWSKHCHTVSLGCLRHLHSSFPAPLSDIMGQSKVTHIYPIIQSFEKTHIQLHLMLQWGPESERCYQAKQLGFQCPANKSLSSLLEGRGGKKEVCVLWVAGWGVNGVGECYCMQWDCGIKREWSILSHFLIEAFLRIFSPLLVFASPLVASFFMRMLAHPPTGKRRYSRWVNGAQLNQLLVFWTSTDGVVLAEEAL